MRVLVTGGRDFALPDEVHRILFTIHQAWTIEELGHGDVFLDRRGGYITDDHVPLNDATNQVVHTEDGTAVHSVMVGGTMPSRIAKIPARAPNAPAPPSRWPVIDLTAVTLA